MELCIRNGVPFYRSRLLPCPHGFATRLGGVSTAEHTCSMNLAFGRGDGEEIVLRNLERFADAVGIRQGSVVSLPQVHGSNVLAVTRADRGDGYYKNSGRSADGYVTTDPLVSLGVKTADCVPILLCGLSDGGEPIAIAALHAGWRGTVARIAEKGVSALVRLGVKRENVRAAIGPAICGSCYEVGAELYTAFYETFGEAVVKEAFSERPNGKYALDLKAVNRSVLVSEGVLPEMIDVSDACTCCSPETFFSHRYSNGLRGTMLSVIALP